MNAHPTKIMNIALTMITVIILGVAAVGCAPPPTQPPPPTKPPLPDLVLLDIILKPKPANYGQQDDVIINTVVRNNGSDATQGFNVWCEFQCKDPATNSPTYFSGMQIENGLGSGQQMTLGDDTLLSLSDCLFRDSRKFTCTVDGEDYVKESDEANNTLEEILMTGR